LRALRLARDTASPESDKKRVSSAELRRRADAGPGERVWSLNDELTFGRYQGSTLRQVLEEEGGRGWVKWALESVRGFELDKDAQAELDAGDDPRAPPKAWESPRY
jgi:hypothetical protein